MPLGIKIQISDLLEVEGQWTLLTFQGLQQSCCGFILPLTSTAADLLTPGVLGHSPHLGQEDNWSVSCSQEPAYNQKLANLREASVPSKKFTWNIRARSWDPNLLRPNRVSYHSRAESAGNNRHFVVFHSEPQLEPRRAHTICRCILDCNEPFCATYRSEKKKGWEKALDCHLGLFKYS